ncbi:putative ubiquitin hydrolase putativecysteine peptidase Clan CA family C19 [Leptomonas pyrrhocoris]|uniref:Putative ubiquitin hydrolase putativecysteine peptidase Clan CA family C19 n=1 Tax=Leptomonas pyrrhocoris TaxID=157538 RepID=A0A0M9G8W3_LEPPY|nr:putative ubiquitin hydrolase putativecysteine peptidase Clan CA family C19 [Leptomonas pyrrhocoris]KPA84909.1 putative ubiquitin hydrolase putativecysteine peptidase Clan CA family C19 [Leptomonas pyrrhocoris]|eukprot:XP_015663348.1 putative ubiquitin hydrolase putativecysteine peptidase Clan CA family C19 [Leptomonas pyrrhocoris]
MSYVPTDGAEEKGGGDSADAFPLSATSRSSFSPSEDEAHSPQLNDDADGGAAKDKVITWDGIQKESTIPKEIDAVDEAESTQTPTPASPLQGFVNSLVGIILEGLRGFDGSITWLKRSSAVTAAQLDVIKAVKSPEHVEEFSVAWFGIASALLRDFIQESVEGMILQVTPSSPTTDAEEDECVGAGVHATPREVAVTFVSGLQSIVAEVMNDCGCHTTSAGGNRSYSRYSLRSFTFAKEVSELSSRLMRDRLTRGAYLPEALRDKYADDATVVDSKDDYSAILGPIADAWICSFFPAYQQLSRNPVETVPYLWTEEEEDISRLNTDLFFYYFFFACEQHSLMKNKEGFTRGVAVPTAWMVQLLSWTAKARQQRLLTPPGPLPQFPGPIDTFDLVSVSPHDPRRHWLRLDTGLYQVIPESLFDSFFRFFGAGPKYTMYGPFPLRNQCLAAWRALPLKVEVTFDWVSTNKEDNVMDSFTVSVYVEEALLHSEMREVCHLAWGLATEEKDTMSEEASMVWFAAVNGNDTVRISCKGLFTLPIGADAFPVAAEGDGMDVTVQEVLQQLRDHIETKKPGSLGEFKKQTKSQVFLSLGVTLHNVNGDGREKEITGTMEVAAHNSGVCGLTNVGNTCYMNSALQCLSNLSAFRTKLLTLPISHFMQATITPAFIKLLSGMWCGQHSFAETRELKDQIGMRVKRFAGYQQQDASEFIEVLLDNMGEEINLVSARCYRQREDSDNAIPTQELSTIFWENFLENNQTFLSPLFFHQSKTVFTCLTCGELSVVFDNNVTLPVSIREPQQKRTYGVEVLVELDRRECATDKAVAERSAASPSRPVTDNNRAFVQATLRVQALVGPDNTVRSHDVEQGLAHALSGVAVDSKEVYSFFFPPGADSGDNNLDDSEEKPLDWWEKKREVIRSRLRVDARLIEVPEHGRVHAWARLSLAEAETKDAVDAATEEQDAAPALRVWYFLKNVNDPAPTTFTTNLVWVDEIAAPNRTPPAENPSMDDSAPFSRHIIARSKEIAASMLERQTEDLVDHETAFVAADALSGGGGYFNSVASAEEEERGEVEHAEGNVAAQQDSPPPTHLDVKVMRRVSRVMPLENVAQLMSAAGDSWLNIGGKGSAEDEEEESNVVTTPAQARKSADCPTTTTVVIFIQYDATSYVAHPVEMAESLCLRAHTSFQTDAKCTLHDCLNYTMEPDVLRGDDAWFCSRCKEFRETRVHRTLYRLPPCLIVSFKRFKMHTYSADKKDTTVQFPTEMDFAPYLDPESVALQTEGTRYRLRGVVYHSGSLSFGHYTATAYNDYVKKWVYYNDTRATLDSSEAPVPNGAYILCFERVPEVKEAR